MTKRRVIQISTTDAIGGVATTALCNDGTIWRFGMKRGQEVWTRLPDITQPNAEEIRPTP